MISFPSPKCLCTAFLVALTAFGVFSTPAFSAPVRYLESGDQIKVRVNPANNITEAITMAALVNPEGLGEHVYVSLLNEAGSPTGYKLRENTEGHLKLSNGFGGAEDPKSVSDTGWQLLAVTKAAGSAKPRFHIYSYTTKTWVHRSASEAMPNGGSVTGGRIRLGGSGSEEYAAAALYSRVLSDEEVESLTTSYEEWLELEPTGMWLLNQPDVTKPVLDETGGGANEIFGETFGTEVHANASLPGDDPDGTIFRGDFYRGVNLEWEEEQLTGSTAEFSIEELIPPLPFENYFGRFSLSSEDIRSEMAGGLHLFEGEDVYIRFLARLGSGFPVEESPTVWGELIWQLHQSGGEGSPPLALHIRDTGGGRYALENTGGAVWWLGPEIDFETWHEFVIRVNNSAKSEVGFIEVWMDGVQQKMSNGLNRLYGATMLNSYNYPKAGYYRDDDMVGTGVLDVAGYRIAKNLSDLP
jgi:Polysaccharide lyase